MKQNPKKIMCVVGTRPEAIKMIPVILALKKETWVEVRVLATAQHRDMLDQVLDLFDIKPDVDLNIMLPDQSLTTLTAHLLLKVDSILKKEKPDIVLVQGDTTTVMTLTLACFYNHIPLGHVEAGLRTGNIQNPFPEEFNRVIAGRLAQWHFAPTEISRQNLIREGISEKTITVTGNTVIDTLLLMKDKTSTKLLEIELDPHQRLILITIHRRENFGPPFREICKALKTLTTNYPDVQFLYPVHPNPNIHKVAYELLKAPNIHLCPPMDYKSFVAAMKRSYIIISDSGGIQEEAPALGKPVLVLREETERPEAVKEGVVKMVGTSHDRIVKEAKHLLNDKEAYLAMAKNISPYGDGQSARRIVNVLKKYVVEDDLPEQTPQRNLLFRN